ncbi:bifunctional 2-polyprenyl-6-hydroxyphenol methylase/3-demethylubiquinol 3-O-methyltransferase UbiG [Alterisphingorhabdus coralli]|uniref:Ubiquinone biosynthesis O-methyltransferase n=1 Tax=Alterisphingorhabdus coralli TaxID=3071408 RepID=A0AA97I0G7_9SPHN|nr:bifunctional 2-polyprenyl-6-hydroxyphenol methylase/3-demethylubiquinol 3-O-methyltransferase UbiG [Parasphingorhabdus sp. SCSIO 66989]WOE74927.1 bifunctional 2-polyprenyl-6-hydroxyphenol methylase/3-demethylubiquinol 3-O-methyltransferase UbiG [Parasphingorhabdus sp. SCSIO 66989]
MASTGTATTGSIIDAEAEHFGKLAADWWDPKGSSAMLHRLNPVRLGYIREAIDRHFESNPRDRRPLAGKKVLDVGCGAGLLCEPLARLGGDVTGLDAAAENIAVAKAHAEQSGLSIDYLHRPVEELDTDGFDLVTSLEVIEHVADPVAFAASLAAKLAPGGLMIVSTPNRTNLSRLLLVEGAELSGMIPRGTHDWNKFLTPEELEAIFAEQGLAMDHVTGIAFSPDKGLHLSDNIALNYIACLHHAE